MARRYGVKAGLSDHTMGSDVAVAAVALGACVVEKHFIIDRSIGGPDAAFSIEDMKAEDVITEKNVRSVRPGYGLHPKYLPEILGKRVNRDLEKGERFDLKYVER